MLPIYICENNKSTLNLIEGYVKDYMVMHHIDDTYKIFTFSNASDFLKSYKQAPSTSIYLLDCELEENIKGPDIAKQIREQDPIGYIVFISAYTKYFSTALSAHINILDFIYKNSKDFKYKLFDALDSAFKIYNDYTKQGNKSNEFYFVNRGGKSTPVKYEDIISVEATQKPHMVVLKTKNTHIEFYDSLDKVLTALSSAQFIRCNRSAIININYIDHIIKATKTIVMKNKKEFSTSTKVLKILQ